MKNKSSIPSYHVGSSKKLGLLVFNVVLSSDAYSVWDLNVFRPTHLICSKYSNKNVKFSGVSGNIKGNMAHQVLFGYSRLDNIEDS